MVVGVGMTALTGIAIMFACGGLMFRFAPVAAARRIGLTGAPAIFSTLAAAGLLGMAALLVLLQFVPE